MAQGVKTLPASAGRHKGCGFDPWAGKAPEEGTEAQSSSCLENSMDRGAWGLQPRRLRRSRHGWIDSARTTFKESSSRPPIYMNIFFKNIYYSKFLITWQINHLTDKLAFDGLSLSAISDNCGKGKKKFGKLGPHEDSCDSSDRHCAHIFGSCDCLLPDPLNVLPTEFYLLKKILIKKNFIYRYNHLRYLLSSS